MSKAQTVAPHTLARVLPNVDAIFFLSLGVLAVAVGVGIILR
jgi:hypothetical protein